MFSKLLTSDTIIDYEGLIFLYYKICDYKTQ